MNNELPPDEPYEPDDESGYGFDNEDFQRSIDESIQAAREYVARYRAEQNHEPTEEDKINFGIQLAQLEKRPIDDATARRLANQLHTGQGSALYSLASSGSIDLERLVDEMLIGAIEDRELLPWYDELAVYVSTRGNRKVQDGWYDLTRDDADIIGWLPPGQPEDPWAKPE